MNLKRAAPWLIAFGAIAFAVWYRSSARLSPQLAAFPLIVPGLTQSGQVATPAQKLSPEQLAAIQQAQPLPLAKSPYLFGASYGR